VIPVGRHHPRGIPRFHVPVRPHWSLDGTMQPKKKTNEKRKNKKNKNNNMNKGKHRRKWEQRQRQWKKGKECEEE
jgi:hypothetical protein